MTDRVYVEFGPESRRALNHVIRALEGQKVALDKIAKKADLTIVQNISDQIEIPGSDPSPLDQFYADEKYDENTMVKVRQVLCSYVNSGDAHDIITDLQNKGIVFRERD